MQIRPECKGKKTEEGKKTLLLILYVCPFQQDSSLYNIHFVNGQASPLSPSLTYPQREENKLLEEKTLLSPLQDKESL